MSFIFESSPSIEWRNGLRFLLYGYLLFLMQTLVKYYVIGSTSITLDKIIFDLFLAAFNLIFFVPAFICILVVNFIGISRMIQVVIGYISCWVMVWHFDFFLGGYVHSQWHGFLLVKDGVVTSVGALFALVKVSIDLSLLIAIAKFTIWRR